MQLRLLLGVLVVLFVSDVVGSSLGTHRKGSDTENTKGTRTNKFKDALKKHRGNKAQETDDELEYVRDKLQKLAARSRKKQTLSKEQQEELSNNLKKIGHRHNEIDRGDRIDEINAIADPDGYLYEGDILLTREEVDALEQQEEQEEEREGSRIKRQAINTLVYPSSLWTFPVPYTLSADFSEEALNAIKKGLAYWEANTCVSFKENAVGNNSISFFPGNGCYSSVGRVVSKQTQELSIGDGCEWIETVTHEVGHALGFFHTQSRDDRDEYVKINTDNVQVGKEHNFNKETSTTSNNYGHPYDYGSVMHYSPFSFAIDDTIPTIVPHDTEYLYTMGSGREGGFYDVLMMNELYSCLDKCSSYNTVCYNGGYMDPKNCAICKCPAGYGGDYCNQRPAGCGEILNATATYQDLTSETVGNGIFGLRDEWDECNYWITAPAGKRIEVRITDITSLCEDGCFVGFVEFKTREDQMLTGYRYCCSDHINKTLVTDANPFPIIVSDRHYRTRFSMSYRYVDDSSTTPKATATTTKATTTTTKKTTTTTKATTTTTKKTTTTTKATTTTTKKTTTTTKKTTTTTKATTATTKKTTTTTKKTTTTTKATTTTTASKDLSSDCAKNQLLCLNSLYKDLMTQQCAKTCAVSTTVTGCADTVTFCAGNEGLCSSTYYIDLMKAKCAKTCKYCVTTSACQDTATNCAANANLCTNVYYKELMTAQCTKTCGLC